MVLGIELMLNISPNNVDSFDLIKLLKILLTKYNGQKVQKVRQSKAQISELKYLFTFII